MEQFFLSYQGASHKVRLKKPTIGLRRALADLLVSNEAEFEQAGTSKEILHLGEKQVIEFVKRCTDIEEQGLYDLEEFWLEQSYEELTAIVNRFRGICGL